MRERVKKIIAVRSIKWHHRTDVGQAQVVWESLK